MADRFSAQISIGGMISRTARLHPDDPDDNTTILQGLIGALNGDGASHEYGDRPIPHDCREEDLEHYLSKGGAWLTLHHAEARNGEFEETEQFCMEHDIPFNRWSDHYCEYDAETAYWRPGMKIPFLTYANSAGNEIVEAAKVREALALLRTFQIGKQGDLAKIAGASCLLREVCPELPPELEVFNINP